MPALSPTPGSDPDADGGDADPSDLEPPDGDSSGGDVRAADVTAKAPDLVGVYEATDAGVECTVFPAAADDERLLTTWVTVDADTICDLENWR